MFLQRNHFPTILALVLFLFLAYLPNGASAELPPADEVQKVTKEKIWDNWNTQVALTGYFDQREYNILTILTSTKNLPLGLDIRVFTDIHSDQDDGANLIYFVPLTQRLSITGFADLNVSEIGSDRWVIEPQLNFKINKRFAVVLEGRYNGFEDADSSLDGTGLALGLTVTF